jgi:hypothetical protein
MRAAVEPIPQTDARTITPAEVRDWFGRRPPPEAACAEIAALLTKMRWASDRPFPALRDGMCWVWPLGQAELVQVPDIDPDPYWDFQGATDAAKTLLASFPRMLRHWDGLVWAPETSGGAKMTRRILSGVCRWVARGRGVEWRGRRRRSSRLRGVRWSPLARNMPSTLQLRLLGVVARRRARRGQSALLELSSETVKMILKRPRLRLLRSSPTWSIWRLMPRLRGGL